MKKIISGALLAAIAVSAEDEPVLDTTIHEKKYNNDGKDISLEQLEEEIRKKREELERLKREKE